ncbi:Pkinase-domain-containing protein [Backusella circina FSU 941]|nr:Pkinase-domain-containing protein [Backusella circina FSU 941]
MFAHIKELFRQRKERQKKKTFSSSRFGRQPKVAVVSKAKSVTGPVHTINAASNNSVQKAEKLVQTGSSDSVTLSDNNQQQVQQQEQRSSNADKIAKLVVEQDKRRKSQIPSYPGLERFELIKKLGDGAFSNVYLACDSETGKKLAIKVAQKSVSDKKTQRHLHSSIKRKPRATERANILKEVQIMSNIKHPNIVQLTHFHESEENYFLILELCEGGELFHQIVKMTYFSENLARHVITQVALAVRHLHLEKGVVHRDIKPENILFDAIPIIPSKKRIRRPTDNENKEDEGEFVKGIGGGGIGTVKLADFGLSKVIWDSSTFTPCGTVGYTAPEIVCDQHYSKSVDMWAIGCVLYTILCGFPPFYDESITALYEKVSRGQFSFLSPWWDPISDSVKDLISHLLCVDAKKRYTIEQLLNHPWIKEEPFIRDDSMLLALKNKGSREPVLTNKESKMVVQTPQDALLTPPETDKNLCRNDDSTVYSTPEAAALREVFDITYAVQRMEEEQYLEKERQKREKYYQQQDGLEEQKQDNFTATAITTTTTTTTVTTTTFKKTVPVPMTQQTPNLPIARKLAQDSRGVASNQYRQAMNPRDKPLVESKAFNGFQLNIDNATLLKNRKIGCT